MSLNFISPFDHLNERITETNVSNKTVVAVVKNCTVIGSGINIHLANRQRGKQHPRVY